MEKYLAVIAYIAARLREPSSIIVVAGAFLAIGLSEPEAQYWASVAAAIAGIVAFLLPEGGQPAPAPVDDTAEPPL